MLHIFVTGGTFDKEYNELNGSLYFNQTHVEEMLAKGRSRLDLRIETLFMKDSLDFTDAERETIFHACEKSPSNRLLITHGTDTMTETAKVLAEAVPGKTICLGLNYFDHAKEGGRDKPEYPWFFFRGASSLIAHGDADKLVPIYQAQIFEKRAQEFGNTVKVIVKPGADHGWAGMDKDIAVFADWFDEHLLGKK